MCAYALDSEGELTPSRRQFATRFACEEFIEVVPRAQVVMQASGEPVGIVLDVYDGTGALPWPLLHLRAVPSCCG